MTDSLDRRDCRHRLVERDQMDKVARYGIGCGSLLVITGIVGILGQLFGWDDSRRSIFQILRLLGFLVGSQYLGAGIFILEHVDDPLTPEIKGKADENGSKPISTQRIPMNNRFYLVGSGLLVVALKSLLIFVNIPAKIPMLCQKQKLAQPLLFRRCQQCHRMTLPLPNP